MENDPDEFNLEEDLSPYAAAEVEKGSASASIDIHRGSTASMSSAESATADEEQVKCECCGLTEECTPAYIAHVRGMYCGRWVCGLCAEAVKEEYGRGGDEGSQSSMEAALDAHMSMCMQFNKPGKRGEKQIPDLAAAMTRLLRRSMDGSTSPRSMPSSPRRAMSRANSCLSTFRSSQRYDAPL